MEVKNGVQCIINCIIVLTLKEMEIVHDRNHSTLSMTTLFHPLKL